jgi:glycerophosphoryl diester phosphodiesterase
MKRSKTLAFTKVFTPIFLIMTVLTCDAFGQRNAFDAQGHRGCRGLMPENTIPAMYKAIDLGVTTLEMDVVITADGKVIVSHDPYMNAEIATNPQGLYIQPGDQRKHILYKLTAAEVQTWDVGLKPHPKFPRQVKVKAVKPLLSDLIDSVELYVKRTGKPAARYNIETKCSPSTDNVNHPDPETFVALLMAVIREKGISKRVTIQSFDKRTLQVLHRAHPRMNASFLIDAGNRSTPEMLLQELGFKPSTISPAYQLVTQDYVEACHRLGVKVLPWTVNDRDTILRLKNLGVDGIISDYPDLFQ